MDSKKFCSELMTELKGKFPDYFAEKGSLPTQVFSAMALVAALAIEKYDRERPI